MRFKKQRIALIRWLVRWFIVPLAGRGVQVIRQGPRSGYLGGNKYLKHAPMCGANHYHHTRPITGRCTCGAVKYWHEQKQQEEAAKRAETNGTSYLEEWRKLKKEAS